MSQEIQFTSPTMRKESAENLLIAPDVKLLVAMQQMNDARIGVLLVVDESLRLVGTLTPGDMRRWIVNSGGELDVPISGVANANPRTGPPGCDYQQAKELMSERQITVLPLVNSERTLVDVILWKDVFGDHKERKKLLAGVDVIVMAGGIGSRMKPFTSVLPKPLLPIHEKPVLEVIMDNLHDFGAERFQVIVNYKKEMVIAYFESAELPYEVEFIDEGELLGTCGGLCKIDRERLSDNFFLTNCDTLLDADFSSIYEFHCDRDNDVTLISTARDFTIPYGVVELNGGGQLEKIVEKPSFHYLVNTGVYVMKKSVLRHLPDGEPFGTPDLIGKVIDDGGRAGVYPLPAGARLDTGQWDEYQHTLTTMEQREMHYLK